MTRAFNLLPASNKFLTSFHTALSSTTSQLSSCYICSNKHCHRRFLKRFYATFRDGEDGDNCTPSTSSDFTVSAFNNVPAQHLSSVKGRINVKFEHGLPTIVVPLPSRQEKCHFTLRPVSDTVGSFCESLRHEDRGIEITALYTEDGMRIASGTNIQHLLRYENFRLRINDFYYEVILPLDKLHRSDRLRDRLETGEKMPVIDDLKAKIASLHTIFNIDDFKVERERLLLSHLEQVELELKPLEITRKKIEEECARHTRRVLWGGFIAMGLQTGVFARLTFYEYSWDIMEPVTYFATFSTVIATFAYYLFTNQEFEYTLAHRRILSQQFHRRARAHNFDIRRYNELSELGVELRRDLERLRDPLLQHLPASRLHALESDRAKLWILNKESHSKKLQKNLPNKNTN